ncbi:hypothetical protein [Diaminobutyricimonas sp. LJ205]|uniref:hypothetical protein n=1 Tax=Diaminobutyricimonas sp. LJ205 TaxID=2683590 RepID=UPI0012F48605|nr:hypothetical protein [Diaminobutyricimonas sp. LJ205]
MNGRTKPLLDLRGHREQAGPHERTVVIDTKSATELRDLASYARDLELAAGYLRHYLAGNIEGDKEYASPLDALWMTSILLYSRAFSKGVRATRGPDLNRISPDEARLHQYILDVRNKYLAHSVNGFEQVEAIAFLTASPHLERAITGIGHVHTSLSRMDRKSAEAFLALCERHARALERRLSAVRIKIPQELAALGDVAVYSLPEHGDPRIDQSASSGRRK